MGAVFIKIVVSTSSLLEIEMYVKKQPVNVVERFDCKSITVSFFFGSCVRQSVYKVTTLLLRVCRNSLKQVIKAHRGSLLGYFPSKSKYNFYLLSYLHLIISMNITSNKQTN